MRTRERVVLFLCTGNYYRSRFAEELFNALAGRAELPWRAESRGLAIERGIFNVGAMSAAVVSALGALGHRPRGATRWPLQAVEADLARSDLVIAVKEDEHRPLLSERFPGWADRVEYWHIHDVDCGSVEEALADIGRQVEALVARLLRAGAGAA
jgi:protein-tyrosine phosphatase